MFGEVGEGIALVWIVKVNFYKLSFLGVGGHTVLLPVFPANPGLDSLSQPPYSFRNLYPSKVWLAMGNIFQTAFQGLCQWPTTKVSVLYFEC